MTAYRADIEIGVRGARSLEQLRSSINQTALAVDSLNDAVSARGSLVQNIQNYTNNLNRAAESLRRVGANTPAETKAIREYVQALGEANTARARQNSLVAQEIANQRRVAPGNAGYGQQGPALPPGMVRAQQVQQTWNRFFQDAAEVAQELKTSAAARTINLKTNWNSFFQDAAEVAQELKTSTATKALNIRTSWNTFFQEARNLAVELTAQVRRTEAAASAAARQRLAGDAARRASIRDAGFGIQGPALPPGFGTTSTGASSLGGGSSRVGGAISSAIIGGGFPLLFGQGPAAAAGGALGGVAGGLLGGGFGFALSIAGTAIGDFIAQADALNVTLAGLNATITSTGTASSTTASDVSELAKNLQITKDEAIELVGAFSQFTDGNIRESLARGFGAVGGVQTFEAIAKAGLGEKEALDAIFSLRKQIGNEAAEQLALQLKSVGATETQAALLRIVSERNIDILVAQSKTVQFTDRLLSAWENIVAALASAVSLAVRFIAKMQEGSLIKLPFLDRIQQVLGKIVGRTPEQIADERGTKLEQQLRKELDDLRKALRQETRAQGIQTSLAESLKPERKGKSAAEREAERLAQQRQKQLEAAARMAVLTEGELQKAVAVTEQEKLNTDYAQQRMERMIKYETLYKEALSSAEIEYLLMAQSNEILAEKYKYQKDLLDIALQQSQVINKADPLASAQQELELLRAKIQGTEKEYLIQKQINDLINQNADPEDARGLILTIQDLEKQNKAIETQKQLWADIYTTVSGEIQNAITGLIKGTAQWGDVLSSILSGLGNLFLNAAFTGLGGALKLPGFASGGFVTRPTTAVVGEGGEPEYVIPASKMRSAMGRYASGARGSNVLSAGGSTGEMGGAATMAPAAIDVRYSVERINNVDYVTADQFQAGMAQAAQQGAIQGERRAMRTLTNSAAARGRLRI